jgi:hypothetical protein
MKWLTVLTAMRMTDLSSASSILESDMRVAENT